MTNRRPAQFLARHWPCAAALGLLASAVAVLTALCLRRCAGHLVYPLDDTYIHMAVADNFVRHGMWGVSPTGFSSCVSSLLWPFALSVSGLIGGVRELTPLLLNFLSAALLLVLVWRLHLRLGHPAWFAALSLLALIFFTPLHVMVMLGMEHSLHALLTVAFIAAAARLLAENRTDLRASWPVWGLAPLLALSRYESLFILAPACFLFLCRRRWRFAIALGLWSLSPLVVYGLIARAHGWHFFPNSVLIKAGLTGTAVNIPPMTFSITLGYMIDNQSLLVPVILALAALAFRVQERRDPWEFPVAFGSIYALTMLPIYVTLRPSLFSRYDAFLVCAGVVSLMLLLPGAVEVFRRPAVAPPPGLARFTRPPWSLALLMALALPLFAPMGWGLVRRTYYTTLMVVPGSGNIYEQQYQMGRFVQKYYPGQAVAANDIGAISYYGKIDCFDLFGLGSAEVLGARRRGEYNASTLANLAVAHKVKVAMFYEHWVECGAPSSWKKAGSWSITDSCVCGGAEVSFYATSPAEYELLKARLREFQSQLPLRVLQAGAYLTTSTLASK